MKEPATSPKDNMNNQTRDDFITINHNDSDGKLNLDLQTVLDKQDTEGLEEF